MAVDTPFETRTALTIKNAQAIPEDGGTAVVSTKTALVRQPKDGTERLKRYRWTKGRSGNPGGRPKKLPLSEGLRAVLDMPVSAQVKSELEKAVDGTLPEEFTWTDAIVLGHVLDTFSKLKGFKPEAAREIRLAVEGRETQRIEVADAPTHTEDDITRHLWTKLGGYEYERCKLFNLPVPENTLAMAKSMGVKLELPPCQQEEQKKSGEPWEDLADSERGSKTRAMGFWRVQERRSSEPRLAGLPRSRWPE